VTTKINNKVLLLSDSNTIEKLIDKDKNTFAAVIITAVFALIAKNSTN